MPNLDRIPPPDGGENDNPNRSSTEWMVVYVTHNLPEAHIVAGRLEHEGIRTIIHSPIGGNALGITIGSLGEITLLVNPEDYEMALAIIEPDTDPLLPEGGRDIIYYNDSFDDDDEYDDYDDYDDEGEYEDD